MKSYTLPPVTYTNEALSIDESIIEEQNIDFTQTCSEIESLLRDSRKKVNAIIPSFRQECTEKNNSIHFADRHFQRNGYTNTFSTSVGDSPYFKHFAFRGSNRIQEYNDSRRKEKAVSLHVQLKKDFHELNFTERYTKLFMSFPVNLRKQIIMYKQDEKELKRIEKQSKERQAFQKLQNAAIFIKPVIHRNVNTEGLKTMDRVTRVTKRKNLIDTKQQNYLEKKIEAKKKYIDYVSTFESPHDRHLFIAMKRRQELWHVISVIASRFEKLSTALTLSRTKRREISTNSPIISKEQDALFQIFSRRQNMAIRIQALPSIERNPFTISVVSDFRKREQAAYILQQYFKHVQRIRMVQEKVHIHCVRIRSCQRIIREFLKSREARLTLARLQIENYQRREHTRLRHIINRNIEQLSEVGSPYGDNTRKIAEYQRRLTDATVFFKIPDIVLREVLLDYLQQKRIHFIRKQIGLVHAQNEIGGQTNSRILSQYIRFRFGGPYFSSFMSEIELKEVYTECQYETQRYLQSENLPFQYLPEYISHQKSPKRKVKRLSNQQKNHNPKSQSITKPFFLTSVQAQQQEAPSG